MHPDNGYYGHRAIILAAAGEHEERPIAAHVQHGWQLGTGLSAPPRLVRGLRKLVWGERHEVNARNAGIKNACAIGAPFVYLVRDTPRPTSPPTRGTIYFPFHSWHRGRAWGSHEDLASAVLDREGVGGTVCLYHLEHARPEVRSAYEAAGFRVVTAGPRDDNPGFLPFLLDELRSHRRVASNHMGTAVLYGALLGLHAEVYGPTFSMAVVAGDHHDRCRREFSEFHAFGGARPDQAVPIARAELGADRLLGPTELRSELGLDRTVRSQLGYRLRVAAEHHIRRGVAELRHS